MATNGLRVVGGSQQVVADAGRGQRQLTATPETVAIATEVTKIRSKPMDLKLNLIGQFWFSKKAETELTSQVPFWAKNQKNGKIKLFSALGYCTDKLNISTLSE